MTKAAVPGCSGPDLLAIEFMMALNMSYRSLSEWVAPIFILRRISGISHKIVSFCDKTDSRAIL